MCSYPPLVRVAYGHPVTASKLLAQITKQEDLSFSLSVNSLKSHPEWEVEQLDSRFPSYILVPDKADYVRGKRPQVECILCAIVREDPTVEPMILRRKEGFIVVLNRYPYNPGHLMIFPERHVEEIEELGEEEVKNMFVLVQKSIRLLKEVYSPHGFNVGINQGRAAGASIAHLHVHVVPRYIGELSFIDLTGSRVIVENLKTSYEKLKPKAEIVL